jgi:hypothetical protein
LTLVDALISLAMPLASVAAAGCECIQRVSASSKGCEHNWKCNVCTNFVTDWNSKIGFSDVTKLLTLKLGYFATVALPWHCQPVGTIKIRGLSCCWRAVCNWLPRSWSNRSYLLMSLWRFVWIRPCCMQHICNVGWCQLLLPFIDGGPFCQFFTYQHLIQSSGRHCEASGWLFGEWWCHEKLCCAAGCSDLQNRSAVMDLMICDFQSWIPHSMMSSFVVTPRGFCSKAYCKGILPDSPYTILLLLPAISFWPKKGEHSMEWHMDRKDTWLALNQSKAKYLGQTMVPKGSTWALESPGWARAGVKKRNVTTGSSWSLSIRLLPSHPWQTMLSFTQLPSPPHLVAKASLRMANDALEWCKQWLTDWPSPSLVTHCLIWENPSGFTLHHLVAPAICFWAKERGAQHGMTHRQKGHVAKLK